MKDFQCHTKPSTRSPLKLVFFKGVLVGFFIILIVGCEPKNENTQTGILDQIVVDSVVADFPVDFSFVSQDEWQFVGYYNKDRALTIASRKVDDEKWEYQVLPTKVGWDSHNRIEMAFDRKNHLHVSGNMHNDSMTYFKMEKAYDVKSIKRVFPLVAVEDELKSTYPSFLKGPENELVYSYRKGGSGNGITILNVYDEATNSFHRLLDTPLFDGLNEMSSYFSGPMLGPDGAYHLTWVWRDTPRAETNHDISYAVSEDLVHWETLDGTKMQLPITPRNHEFVVDPVPAGGGAINGGLRLFFDEAQRPLIVFMKYDEAGMSQLYIAKAVDGLWQIKKISDWDYRWNFSGPGSLGSDIRITKAKVLHDTITIDYWHIKRGDGSLYVHLNNLNLLNDKQIIKNEKSIYPTELMHAANDSLQVHWLQSNSNSDEAGDYVLRWETMGKRRFYKPREVPVLPSVLTMYKIKKEENYE